MSNHKPCRVLPALFGMIVASTQMTLAQVTVEVVNDSGKPDSTVYLRVLGAPGGGDSAPLVPSDLFLNPAAPGSNTWSLPLTTLATHYSAAPYLTRSTLSGRTNAVYSLEADYVNAGTIYFTYDTPFNFTNGRQPSPPPNSIGNTCRYDYAELTINNTNAQYNAVDLTYVDKFGIPMQVEWFQGTQLVAGSYVYLSTKSLAGEFQNAGLGEAIYSLGVSNISAGWQYSGTNSYTNFARILAPQKISGSSSSVLPYSSVTNYLDSLVGSGKSFQLNGASPQKNWHYIGYLVTLSTNSEGWTVTLAQGTNLPAYDPSKITGSAYTNTIRFGIGRTNASQYVYGAPVGPQYYTVNGHSVPDTTGGTYPVEVWMIGDALSALNFGFWGGRYGTNSADWFSPAKWTAFPFGSARETADDYYNSYAALIYNYADPYSFAFSERITPDVLMAPTNGDRVRITLLPDDRLDSPTVLIPGTNAITTNSIALNWSAVAGATGYRVNVLRPLGVAPISLPANTVSYTLTNLQPGAPYVVSVQATGVGANGNAIITPARPWQVATAGTLTPSEGTLAYIQATFDGLDPYYQLSEVYLNGNRLTHETGQWLTNGVPARWYAAAGTNQVVVKVVGADGQVVFNDWLSFELAPAFLVGNETRSAISNIRFFGQKLNQPAPKANGFLGGTTATNFLVSTQNVCLSIDLSYVPAETRRHAPVAGAGADGVRIREVAPLPGGGIQFKFTMPPGTPYAVEASPNLQDWRTNATGTGQAAAITYTNAAGTNARQFYRVQY